MVSKVEEWLIYKKWTLICIMVSTRAKLALNKKTLDKKPVSTLQNKQHTNRKSVSTSQKNCFHCQELKKQKKTDLGLISVMLSSNRKKALNKSTRFVINSKSTDASRVERFDENSIFPNQKKVLPLAGRSAKIQENCFNEQE